MVTKPPEISEQDSVCAGKQRENAGWPHIIPPSGERSRGQKEQVEPATPVRDTEVCCWRTVVKSLECVQECMPARRAHLY